MSKTHRRMHSLPALAFLSAVVLSPGIALALPSSDEPHVSGASPRARFVGGVAHAYGRRVAGRSASVTGHGVGLGDSIDPLEMGRRWKAGLMMARLRLQGFTLPNGKLPGFMKDPSWGSSPGARPRGLVLAGEGRVLTPENPKTPTNPMPEPGAALLFAAGLGIAATWPRARRRA